jgi:serine phosphatase RsbU (regulator of sigma subunit)
VISQAYQAEYYAQSLAFEKMSQELRVAGEIQSSFLPTTLPELPGWQLAVTLEPARQTSGDFYDFIPLPDGRLGLLVADVADKGIGPALYMALSRTLIRTYAFQHGCEPHLALQAANQRILEDTQNDLFVTVFYGVLDPADGTFRYCNAGHNPPYLFSPDRETAQTLTRTAMPLGLFDDQLWEMAEVRMQPGDLLLLYTDGIVEAQDEEHELFGEAYLQQLGHYCRVKSAVFTQEKIVDAVYDFVGDAEQSDDMTLLVLKRENPS